MDHFLGWTGQTETKDRSFLSSWLSNIGVVDLWHVVNPTAGDSTHLSARHKAFSQINFIFESSGVFQEMAEVILFPVDLPDLKAVIALVSIISTPLQAPKWRFNTTLLCDESVYCPTWRIGKY